MTGVWKYSYRSQRLLFIFFVIVISVITFMEEGSLGVDMSKQRREVDEQGEEA